MKGMFASIKATFTGSASQTSSSDGVKAAQTDSKVEYTLKCGAHGCISCVLMWSFVCCYIVCLYRTLQVLDDLGKALYSAANDGDSSKVASLLENAGINVNFQNEVLQAYDTLCMQHY